MSYETFLFGVFLGVLLGIFFTLIFTKYLFPILDLKLDVYQYTQNEKATKHHINSQITTMEFYRKYPEAKEDGEFQETNVIGFQHYPSTEFDDEEDDGYCQGQVGF